MTRRITVDVDADGMDFEDWPQANERGYLKTKQITFLEEGNRDVPVLNAVFSWGGECRSDISLKGSVNGGKFFATGLTRLFEGTSEDTGDLDGQETINFSVGKGDSSNVAFTVRNTDENAQDRATWRLTVSNNITE
jgi:hypothetical protein